MVVIYQLKTMAKNFGIGPGPHELKIGSSFTGGRGPKYQTIRYDFKPASVDPTKKSQVEIGVASRIHCLSLYHIPMEPLKLHSKEI